MADIVDAVKKKIEVIRNLRQKQSHQEGQEKQLLRQLKDEIGVDTAVEAEKKLEEFGQELVNNEKLLEKLDKEMGEIISTATAGSNSEAE